MSNKSACVLFMILAVSLFAAITMIAKLLGSGAVGAALHPFQISAGRFCFAILLLTPIYMLKRPKFGKTRWKLHIGRGISGWLGVSCLFVAATQIPLADANAISFMSVIITMALSIPMLGEHVGIKRWTAAFIALVGAVVLVRPGTDAFHPAAIVALLGAGFIGFEAILIKRLSGLDEPLKILVINNAIGALISILVVQFFWINPNSVQWIMLVAIGVTMVCAQYCFIQALKRMDASFAMPFWYATPLFAAVYDLLIFDHVIGPASLTGILLIAIGGVVICRRS